jgi:hypothetical protein
MKLLIENTDQIISVEQDGASIPARLWEGHTDKGIYVQCLVLRIAVPSAANQEDFDRELMECSSPFLPSVFPLRMVL